MTTALVFLALCLLWGLPIVVSFCLCHAAKREPVQFGVGERPVTRPETHSKTVGCVAMAVSQPVASNGWSSPVGCESNRKAKSPKAIRPTHTLTLSSGLVAQLEDAGHSRLTATDCAGRNASHDPSISGSMYEGSNPSEARHLTLSSPQEL